jgi:hypothetical protein
MDTNRLADSKAGQVGQVGLSRVVPVGSKGWDTGLYSSPVPPSLATLPGKQSGRRRCPTLAKRKAKSLPEPWPPPELCLPNLDTLEALSRGEQPPPEPPAPHDTQTAAKCQLSFPALLAIDGVTTADHLPHPP